MTFYEASEAFIRTKLEPFTVQEFQAYLKKNRIKVSPDDIYALFGSTDCVFPLVDERFITLAGAFTGRLFSFKPTREECEAGAFIPGHRFIPFADPATRYYNQTILLDGKPVPPKVTELTMNTVLDIYALFGEGYCIPMVLEDPACDRVSFSQVQYGLPSSVKQTGWSLEPYFEKGFEYGDRIICRVEDWDKGTINTLIKKEKHTSLKMSFSDVANEEWYSAFEECMLRQIERHGPCSSIHHQLALLFLEDQGVLCNENCGSTGDFLEHTSKLDFKQYGIESRIWKAHEEIPYIGTWNKQMLEIAPFPPVTLLSAEHVLNCFIKDMLYRNEPLESGLDLFNKVYPKDLRFTDAEEKFVTMHLQKRIDVVKKSFNRFIDFPIARDRHSCILFFQRVMGLVAKVSVASVDLAELPQQELIMLSQIAENASNFLDEFELVSSGVDRDTEDMMTSMGGMNDAYESIEPPLLTALKHAKKRENNI